jgi:hypothetical protein
VFLLQIEGESPANGHAGYLIRQIAAVRVPLSAVVISNREPSTGARENCGHVADKDWLP